LARILHVDDDESWRELIMGRLGDHEVDSAESLRAAIHFLQNELPYDVALVDLNLAGDSDGQGGDLLDLMRIRHPSTRRILVTGSPPGGSVRKNLFDRYDVDEIIIKRDMNMPDLRRVVEEAINQGPAGPSHSLRLSRSILRQRFRDWQMSLSDRLQDEDEGFKVACSQLRELLENIENETQFDSALEALDAAEERFAAQLEEHRPMRTAREPGDPPARSGSQALPVPDSADLRSSIGAKAADYAVGDLIDGRFEILDVLGQGGFSKVYRVHDQVEDVERALKLFESAAGYAAVRREIGALRKIRHPNVVEVFWAGRTNTGDWYLIAEFIDGEPLSEFTTGKRHLRDREAVDVALDLLDALVAFHPDAARIGELGTRARDGDLTEVEFHEWTELKDKGLVHRDIKPLNVMLTRTGAKLLDFNIASRVGDPVYTHSGTPPYQPPDASNTQWDISTDLFAVGVVLYQLLCNGSHPYPNGMPMADVAVIDPRTIRPDLSPGLAEFLIKACAPASANRFSTAVEMQLALRAIRHDL
jgi:CheY-like chemotaxis protein